MVPIMIRTSILALLWEMATPEERRVGQPSQNITGVAKKTIPKSKTNLEGQALPMIISGTIQAIMGMVNPQVHSILLAEICNPFKIL